MKKFVSALAFASVLPPVCAQPRRFSADDLTRIVRITDPQISPDGKTIAVVVSRANLKEDRWDAELDLIDTATAQIHTMTHDRVGVATPRWSESSDRIAYLAEDAAKKRQIFVLPIDGGDSVQLTRSKSGVSLLAWKPDGSALAYAAPDEEPEKKDEAKFDDAFEVGNNDYLERSRGLPVHLWLASTTDGSAKRLTSGSWSLPSHFAPAGPPSQIGFTPDGRQIVFVKADSPITGDTRSSRITLLDIATGSTRGLTSANLQESDPILSPDGARVAYAFPRDGKLRNETALYIAPVAGGPGTDAAYALDKEITGAAWMPDGRSLLLASIDGTRGALWMQTIGGQATRLDLGTLSASPAINVGKTGSIAFTASAPNHPSELFYIAHAGDAPRQLTHLQTVTDELDLGKPETVRWKSDRFDVGGVLTYPPGYVAAKKYPLVLYIHGGPTSASLDTFSPPAQILAAQGWLVFEPNYRGSNDQGNAFQTAIVQDSGAGPGRDVMAGLAMLEKRGIVDETRVAVSGWSYGGYMTSWLIGNYPNTWKAAVAGAPVTDIVDQYTLSDNNVQRASGYGPSPFIGDNMKTYAVQSPITYAWRIKAPTLIMSDVGDWRVTTTQAYKLFHALKDNNVPVKFIAYPVPGHSPADPIRSRDVWRRWTAWMQSYLNTNVATAPSVTPAVSP